jgi:hypothetical protein
VRTRSSGSAFRLRPVYVQPTDHICAKIVPQASNSGRRSTPPRADPGGVPVRCRRAAGPLPYVTNAIAIQRWKNCGLVADYRTPTELAGYLRDTSQLV